MTHAKAHTSLYDAETYQAMLANLNAIEADTPAQWGKMNAAQMCAHCSEVFAVTNGETSLEIPFFMRLLTPIIRMSVFGKKPNSKNSQTSPEFIVNDERDFAIEKARLLKEMEIFYNMDKSHAMNIVHPLFGKMTLEQRGWAMLKHLDHHFTQFGQKSLVFES